MGWNDSIERRKFQIRHEKLEKTWREAGMTEEAIQAMHDFDFQQFKSDRRFYMNTQALDTSDFEDEDDNDDSCSTLLVKFGDRLSTTIDEAEHSRFWWIEEINDPELLNAVKLLSSYELDILTKYVIEGRSQTETATVLNVSQSSISQKIEKISGFLKNAYKKRLLDAYQLRG